MGCLYRDRGCSGLRVPSVDGMRGEWGPAWAGIYADGGRASNPEFPSLVFPPPEFPWVPSLFPNPQSPIAYPDTVSQCDCCRAGGWGIIESRRPNADTASGLCRAAN